MTQTTNSRLRTGAALALVAYSAVVVALTMLKAFFVIGMLWRPESQRGRSMEWVPFALYRDSTTWFGPLFDYLGNMAFFVPVGVLLYILLEHRRRATGLVVVVGLLASATVETLQYLFALGHSDVSDLLFNTVGAGVGAVIARLAGRRLYPVWIGLALVAVGVMSDELSGPSSTPQAVSPASGPSAPQTGTAREEIPQTPSKNISLVFRANTPLIWTPPLISHPLGGHI